ncbi:unnamed protein product [Prorocentrum cordatum]|uniref:Uncharacterized protein n=1 Tax=Prorocentrum cordatum TaxID=2364126 RepID=A0ABN9UVR5_9DINO|nr:unnamed protein product [Polarella glacialis]CAK0864215.1 unnamed protein product [Polarella glacialis]
MAAAADALGLSVKPPWQAEAVAEDGAEAGGRRVTDKTVVQKIDGGRLHPSMIKIPAVPLAGALAACSSRAGSARGPEIGTPTTMSPTSTRLADCVSLSDTMSPGPADRLLPGLARMGEDLGRNSINRIAVLECIVARQQAQLASLMPLLRELPAAHAALGSRQDAAAEELAQLRRAKQGLEDLEARLDGELGTLQASLQALESALGENDGRLNEVQTAVLESRVAGAADLDREVTALAAKVDVLASALGREGAEAHDDAVRFFDEAMEKAVSAADGKVAHPTSLGESSPGGQTVDSGWFTFRGGRPGGAVPHRTVRVRGCKSYEDKGVQVPRRTVAL